MKTTRIEIRMICAFLGLLILLQSCRVYHKTPVSLDQAVKEEKRVKIKTEDGKTYKFHKVIFEDGRFYGVRKEKGEMVKTPIEQNQLRKVRLHNKTLSIIYGIGITLLTSYGVTFIVALLTWDLNLN